MVLVADDLGWGALGARGSRIRTPHLDRFFTEGVELRRFYTAPLCTPTRAALLTGRSPQHLGLSHGVLHGWSRTGLPGREVTLAERLRERGYRTALVGKWHLGHARREFHPNAQGFEHFYGHLIGAGYYEHTFEGGLDFQRNGEPLRVAGYATTLLGAEMVRVIEADDPRPLLLVGAFYAPHRPFEAPAELLHHYRHFRRADQPTYAAMIEALDAAIGQVLLALERTGLAREAIVVFLSDNGATGWPGGNQPLRGAKGTVFEGGIRVPAALRWPGRVPGGTPSEQLVRDFDLFPTLLAAAGHTAPDPALDGRNLLPALVAGERLAREPFFFSGANRRAAHDAVIDYPWKLVATGPPAGARTVELFHLEDDPAESRDRAVQQPQIAERLARLLERWVAQQLRNETREARPAGWQPPRDWSALARE